MTPSRHRAAASGLWLGTMSGLGAIAIWATLALLVTFVRNVPPFQLVAMSFFLAFLVGISVSLFRGDSLRQLAHLPLSAWLLGVGGLFGYHFLYFFALGRGPVVAVSLINYLWPLLIVLFSALLPAHKGGGRLGWHHLLGAALGFGGVFLILGDGAAEALASHQIWLAYGAAGAAAVVWAGYSVLSRLQSHIPSRAVAFFCLASAVGALLAHLAFETTVWPKDGWGWAAILALGLGPAGGAFYLWDRGMKQGDIRTLGVAAYLTPLLSTLLLSLREDVIMDLRLWLACVAITLGALLAAKHMLTGAPTASEASRSRLSPE